MDNNEIVISFCLPAYNQTSLVKQCIESIIKYKGNDIEIVISDDNSQEDLEQVVALYNDSRIKYYRNNVNLGHDLNILHSFRVARGKYAFLLRSRDYMISESISALVEYAKKSSCVFATASCVDEEGNNRFQYSDQVIKAGRDALDAHFALYVHPSGSMYLLKALELDRIEAFLNDNIDGKYGFLVHQLVRMYLSRIGDFSLIKRTTWVYTNTLNQKDVAQNKTTDRVSVYDPSFVKLRFLCEAKWARELFNDSEYDYVYERLYTLYLDSMTWAFWYRNRNKHLRHHYQFSQKKHSVLYAHKDFCKNAKTLYCDLTDRSILPKELNKQINNLTKKNMLFGWVRYSIMNMLSETNIYRSAGMMYQKYKDKKNGMI